MLDDKFNMIATADESSINRKNNMTSNRRTNSAGLAKLLEALLDVGHDVCVRRATRGGKCGGVEGSRARFRLDISLDCFVAGIV